MQSMAAAPVPMGLVVKYQQLPGGLLRPRAPTDPGDRYRFLVRKTWRTARSDKWNQHGVAFPFTKTRKNPFQG